MRPGPLKDQDQLAMVDSVDQQPIRLYVAFSVTDVISHQRVVTVRRRQRFLALERVNDRAQQGQIFATFEGFLQIPAKLRSLNQHLHQSSESRSDTRSSNDAYRFADTRPATMSSASRIAASVVAP